jgi:hypothetical protein
MLHSNSAAAAFGTSRSLLQNENVIQSSVKGKSEANKTPSTKRRAFGDISNRKAPLQAAIQKDASHQPAKKTGIIMPSKNPVASLLLPSRTSSNVNFDETLPRSIRSTKKLALPKTPNPSTTYVGPVEDVEWPAGRLFSKQHDWSDDELSDCSLAEYTRDSWKAMEDIYKARTLHRKLAFEAQARDGDEYHFEMMDMISQQDSLGMQAPDDVFSVPSPIDLSLEEDDFTESIHITDISF